jgi:hypothetical protein
MQSGQVVVVLHPDLLAGRTLELDFGTFALAEHIDGAGGRQVHE